MAAALGHFLSTILTSLASALATFAFEDAEDRIALVRAVDDMLSSWTTGGAPGQRPLA